jgi:hypothetical protein
MLRLLRFMLVFAAAVLLTEAVIGVASTATGWIEKAIIVAAAAALVLALPRLRRLGAR